jgi:hypothetical protein
LYEFGHSLFNLAFCDPRYTDSVAGLYLRLAQREQVIDPAHFPALYTHIYRFAVSDMADFEELNTSGGLPPERQTDLAKLSAQYAQALARARAFFRRQYPDDLD